MKLKELLEVVPDKYIIGLMDADVDNYSTLCFGHKDEVIKGFGHRAGMPPAHVKNLNVTSIHPGVNTYLPDGVDMYGEDSAELRVKTMFLIEVSTEEEEK